MMKQATSKRAIDVILSLALLPFALPLCLILMLAIRLEGPGSPLFVQNRVGRHKVVFRMLKLRTMAANTGHVPSHMVRKDSITKVGRLLRRLKLDELPQLLNVLEGSMSLVGPRPCLPTQTELIKEREKSALFAFRPGVTGPAQLLGIDMSDPRRLAQAEADYFRISNSLKDLGLIVKTATGCGSGDAANKVLG